MTENIVPAIGEVADLMRDRGREGLPIHPALAVPGWAAQYAEVEDDEQELCDWCDEPIDEDRPGEPCSGRDGRVHSDCHAETDCRRAE